MDSRKRGRAEYFNGAGFKKYKPEMDSLSSGIGSKSKPCTKFFSMAGCPFGENCHFLHYVPGGYNAVAQARNLPPAPPPHAHNGSAPAVKTKICNNFKSGDCKFGEKCNFAHGERDLGKPIVPSNDTSAPISIPSRMVPPAHAPGPAPAASSFGLTATAKISVDASLAGAVIGKGGVNSKQICRQTGAKLSVRDHETDQNLKNIELEGSFEQIQHASAMVREMIVSIGPVSSAKSFGGHSSNLKTKLCENFGKGSCTFGERCHFAHGTAELRKLG